MENPRIPDSRTLASGVRQIIQAVFAYYGLNAMLLTLDSNAFWVTKSTKDTRSARRKIIVRDLVWGRFSSAFSSSCSTNTFQVRKPTKVLLQIGFLCAPSCSFVFFVTLAGLPDRSKL
jgi:hypothetical protein